MSAPAKSTGQKTYFSNGQALQSPPLSARFYSFLEDAYAFAGLYFTTLFSTDALAAAEASPFSTQGRSATRSGSTWTGGGGRTTGSQPRTFGNSFRFNMGGGGDQVRVPGCGSCG